jgi:hypothetical protein
MTKDPAYAGYGKPSGILNPRAAPGLTITGKFPTNIASGTDLTCAPLPSIQPSWACLVAGYEVKVLNG